LADPDEDRRRSVGVLEQVLDYLRHHAPGARLIFPSSAAVYGHAGGPALEDTALDPISPYGRHKAMAEALIAEAASALGLDAVIIRFFSAYGPGLRKQLLWELGQRLAARPAEVELSGTGDETRDFLFVDDATALIGLAAGLERRDEPWVLNGGAGEAVSVRQVAQGLAEALGALSRILFNGIDREGDPRSLVADIGRAAALGFRPRVGLDEGLARYARWFSGQA
jgi:UDP-glucose 4-epimerase